MRGAPLAAPPSHAPQSAKPFLFVCGNFANKGMRLRAHQRAFRSPSGLLRGRPIKIVFGDRRHENLSVAAATSPLSGETGQKVTQTSPERGGGPPQRWRGSPCGLYRSLCSKMRPRRVQGRSESPWRAPQSAEPLFLHLPNLCREQFDPFERVCVCGRTKGLSSRPLPPAGTLTIPHFPPFQIPSPVVKYPRYLKEVESDEDQPYRQQDPLHRAHR